jgi:hypothetical protein
LAEDLALQKSRRSNRRLYTYQKLGSADDGDGIAALMRYRPGRYSQERMKAFIQSLEKINANPKISEIYTRHRFAAFCEGLFVSAL